MAIIVLGKKINDKENKINGYIYQGHYSVHVNFMQMHITDINTVGLCN
jgi:hypothetical protein